MGELELLAVVWGSEKFRFYLYGKKDFFYTDHQALEPLIKRNRCNRQYSARLTRWLDRLAHFDIAIQNIAGSNLKFTDFLSRNPVEDVYNEQYVINILSEQAELNRKYGPIFADQSQNATALQCIGKLFCCMSWNPGHENSAACPWNACLWNPGLMT